MRRENLKLEEEKTGIFWYNISMKRLPDFLREYFWEVDFDRLDSEDRPDYILERLLEYEE